MRQIMADLNAIAEAVKNEIARQQASVNYEDLSQDELERVVKQLQDRLACVQGLLSKRGGEPKSEQCARWPRHLHRGRTS